MSSPRFIVDAMLGSLARKLRIFGFDTTYYKTGVDSGLLEIAKEERRVILTSDKSLRVRAVRRGMPAIMLSGRTDRERILSLVDEAGKLGYSLEAGVPLCALCNGSLSDVKREGVKGLLPSELVAKHRRYYVCNECGKVYWHGSHWSRLRKIGVLMSPRRPNAFNQRAL